MDTVSSRQSESMQDDQSQQQCEDIKNECCAGNSETGNSSTSQKDNENGHFLWIPSLKVPPDVEDLGLVVNTEITIL